MIYFSLSLCSVINVNVMNKFSWCGKFWASKYIIISHGELLSDKITAHHVQCNSPVCTSKKFVSMMANHKAV